MTPNDKQRCGACKKKLKPPEPFRIGYGKRKEMVCKFCFKKYEEGKMTKIHYPYRKLKKGEVIPICNQAIHTIFWTYREDKLTCKNCKRVKVRR